MFKEYWSIEGWGLYMCRFVVIFIEYIFLVDFIVFCIYVRCGVIDIGNICRIINVWV